MTLFKLPTVALAAMSAVLSIGGKASAAAINTAVLDTRENPAAIAKQTPWNPTYTVVTQTLVEGTPFNAGVMVSGGGTLSHAESYAVGTTVTVGADLGSVLFRRKRRSSIQYPLTVSFLARSRARENFQPRITG